MVTIVLGGYYGFENAGDELILAAIVREFRRSCPSSRLVVLSANPNETRRVHGVEAVDRWNLLRVLSVLKGCDRFVLGGGGLFQDTTSLRSFLYYLALLVAGHFRSKSMALYAVGIENVGSIWARSALAFFLRRFQTPCYVRDEESAAQLRKWNVPETQIHRSPDAAFLLGPVPRPSLSERVVMFIPRFPAPANGEKLYLSILKSLQSAPVSFQTLLLHPTLETAAWNKFSEENHINAEFRSWNHPAELMNILSEASAVLSARYHGLLISEMAGVPTVGFGLEEKAGRYCREWGRPFLSTDSTDEEVEKKLASVLVNVTPFERRPEVLHRSQEARETFREVFVPPVENS